VKLKTPKKMWFDHRAINKQEREEKNKDWEGPKHRMGIGSMIAC
jgi:hypothetical protein